MLFNSLDYAVFLFVVVVVLECIRTRELKLVALALAGYFFYFFDNGLLLAPLIFSTAFNFLCGRRIYLAATARGRKAYLALDIAVNLGMLAFFKYANFGIESMNSIGRFFGYSLDVPFMSVILPVGISFYTFEAISYAFDLYRRKTGPADSLRDFAAYLAFFPTLLSGPIVRAADFLPQLKSRVHISGESAKPGITQIAWGLAKKVVLADNIAPFVNMVFADPTPYTSIPIMLGALAFGVQLYCDFSGYTDIAIGSARLLGFRLPVNFNRPYIAMSPTEFWRRWHISLSSWLRDYLYIPLGGSRKGSARTYVNIMVTMILGGLWHGAAWHFVLWGFYHGLLQVAGRLISGFSGIPGRVAGAFRSKPGKIALAIITQYFVFLGWLIFRVGNTQHMLHSISQYLSFNLALGYDVLLFVWLNRFALLFVAAFVAGSILTHKRDLVGYASALRTRYWIIFLAAVSFVIVLLYPSASPVFIYFQF